MVTQHLSIVQSKHLFMSRDAVAYFCRAGLNPADAKRFELRPLLIATLNVEHLSIYWQRLYFADAPLPLASFLYLAWTEFHNLGGLPDTLLVDPELFQAYPLRRVISQLDPQKVIKKLAAGDGRPFGSTKRAAQMLAKHAIGPVQVPIPHLGLQVPARLETPQETLAKLNERLESYHRSWQDRPRPGMNHTESEFLDQVHHSIDLPHWPTSLNELHEADWMHRQADTIRPLAHSDTLKIDFDIGWYAYVSRSSPPRTMDNASPMSPQGGGQLRSCTPGPRLPHSDIWVRGIEGFRAVIRALPFPPVELFASILDPEELEDFTNGRHPVGGATADLLEKRLFFDVSRGGLVLFPESSEAFGVAIDALGSGGGERCTAELVAGAGDFPLRVFAQDQGPCLNILVVRKGSSADAPNLRHMLYQSLGEVSVGPQGFAAITYWLEHLIRGFPRDNSRAFLEMVDAMLATVPCWSKANRSDDGE